MICARRLTFLFCTGMLLAASGTQALAQAPATTESAPAAAPKTDSQRLAELEKKIKEGEKATADAALAGNNAWMLTACALVLFMTAPGLAMFYGGLVRKKNVLSVMMQCIFLMALMTVIWGLYGYSLAFGGTSPWIGNFDHLLMKGLTPYWDTKTVVFPQVQGVPALTFMLFQGMFFIITPALICGAFAERMKFSAMVVFAVLWGTFVYCPICHWVWTSNGILFWSLNSTTAWGGGALDFAGGTVVHISSGVSALLCALVIGRRLGFGAEDMRPHNLTFTAMGAAMLWVGWFGFNAGSGVTSGGLASSAFAATHFAAAAGAIAWAVAEWVTRGKPSVLGAASGAVAGLVCITPASGFVTPMPSLAMGAAAGALCYFACFTLKGKFRYDDALDAFGVHGVGGTLGAILTGVFATRDVHEAAKGTPLGLLEGGSVLKGQLIAVAVTWVFSIVVTFILLKIIDMTMGLRVTKEQEMQGLDITQHGEEGYIFN